MSKKNKIMFILAFYSLLIGQEENIKNYSFDFYFLQSIKQKNVLIKNNEWNDKSSTLNSNLSYTGGTSGKTHYELSLSYYADLENTNQSWMNIDQLYIKTPLSDFLFFTAGKRKKEFGFGLFYNHSNLFSPKKIVYGRIERSTPGICEVDWIVSPEVSLGFYSIFNNAKNWNDLSYGSYLEYNYNNFCSSFYTYRTNNNINIGSNMSYQTEYVRFFIENIYKKNEGETNISYGAVSEISEYTLGIEHTFLSNGLSKQDVKTYYDTIEDSSNIELYEKNYFVKNYVGLSFSKSNFLISNLSFSLTNLFSLGYNGAVLSSSFSYLHNNEILFNLGGEVNYGDDLSEYRHFITYDKLLYLSVGYTF